MQSAAVESGLTRAVWPRPRDSAQCQYHWIPKAEPHKHSTPGALERDRAWPLATFPVTERQPSGNFLTQVEHPGPGPWHVLFCHPETCFPITVSPDLEPALSLSAPATSVAPFPLSPPDIFPCLL